jgi:hypothetical protein
VRAERRIPRLGAEGSPPAGSAISAKHAVSHGSNTLYAAVVSASGSHATGRSSQAGLVCTTPMMWFVMTCPVP